MLSLLDVVEAEADRLESLSRGGRSMLAGGEMDDIEEVRRRAAAIRARAVAA